MLPLVILITALVASSASLSFDDYASLRPCPKLQPHPHLQMEQLTGEWYLKLLVLDANEEDFAESGSCLIGYVRESTNSSIVQDWSAIVKDPTGEQIPSFSVSMSATVLKPGVWTVDNFIGGKLKAVLFGYTENDMAAVVHCVWHKGTLRHLWTAAVTRAPSMTPINLLIFNHLLKDNNYDLEKMKIITWDDC